MSIIEQLVRIFAPHVCIGCGDEQDRLICDACVHELLPVPSRCYRCGTATRDYHVCRSCKTASALESVVVGVQYKGLARQLVHHVKYERAQAGALEMAAILANHALVPLGPVADLVITHIPTASSRVRARGYDHASLLARAVARTAGVRRTALLARHGQARQMGASRSVRRTQLESAFWARNPAAVRGRHVVLVDDVLTTGSTLETAARELRRSGAVRVDALVFAQA